MHTCSLFGAKSSFNNYIYMNARALVAVLFLAKIAVPAVAGISSDWPIGPTIVLAESEPRTVGVSFTMPADFVSVPVRVSSEQKNTAAAYEEARQTIELITRKAKDSGQFQTSMGVVSLSQQRGGYGLSLSKWSQPAAAADIYLLVPFSTNANSGSIFEAGARAVRFVESLGLPGKARCELGRLQLAVTNPEQYRTKLLKQISEEIQRTRQALAVQGGVKVAGLESPVMVRQVDDRNVALSLNYSFSVSEEK